MRQVIFSLITTIKYKMIKKNKQKFRVAVDLGHANVIAWHVMLWYIQWDGPHHNSPLPHCFRSISTSM